MIRSFSLAGFLVLLVLNLSAYAACGGGGNAPSSPPVTHQSEVRQSSDFYVALDTNRFDQISPRLNLSREQMKEVNRIEADINRKAGDGNMRGNEARQEFDRRLADVLNADQLRTYYTLR
ncbi:MAG TPA: hypothetical protein VKX17_23065 [Planctomycetota bacterium]|nr:hypothetical protein [Planctomycetota bacterium]